jgi:hypothetical protein
MTIDTDTYINQYKKRTCNLCKTKLDIYYFKKYYNDVYCSKTCTECNIKYNSKRLEIIFYGIDCKNENNLDKICINCDAKYRYKYLQNKNICKTCK